MQNSCRDICLTGYSAILTKGKKAITWNESRGNNLEKGITVQNWRERMMNVYLEQVQAVKS